MRIAPYSDLHREFEDGPGQHQWTPVVFFHIPHTFNWPSVRRPVPRDMKQAVTSCQFELAITRGQLINLTVASLRRYADAAVAKGNSGGLVRFLVPQEGSPKCGRRVPLEVDLDAEDGLAEWATPVAVERFRDGRNRPTPADRLDRASRAVGDCGRDARHRAPPAQIPAYAIRALGSHLG